MVDIKWNLVDLLSEDESEDPTSGKRRKFYLPLASIPPGISDLSRTLSVNKDLFDPSDDKEIPNDFPALIINIKPTGGYSFHDDGSLPDPSIRLHAIADGMLTFKPATDDTRDSLILKIPIFEFPHLILKKVKWWKRWMEASCIPQTIIYENVDKNHLKTVLDAIQAPPTSLFQDRVQPTFGLSFPSGVTQDATQLQNFKNSFLEGIPNYFLVVESGGYMGKVAAKNLSEIDNPNSEKQLILKVLYHDHEISNPHYMNPRELYHLLFGNDSYEANHHPLLLKLQEKGNNQHDTPIESKKLLLRPPLRTYARLKWEAEKEISNHADPWGSDKKSGHITGWESYSSGTDTHRADLPFMPNLIEPARTHGRVYVDDTPLKKGSGTNTLEEDEYYWDETEQKLYIRLSGGANPSTKTIEAIGNQTVGPERFYNTQPPFFKGPYGNPYGDEKKDKAWKCNLFVCEICLRSGFRIKAYRDPNSGLLFYKAPDPSYKKEVSGMSLAADIRTNNNFNSEGFALLTNNDGSVNWGRRWAKKLVGISSPDDRCDEINKKMIDEEGRCFVLVKAKKVGSGHIMIVHRAVKDSDRLPVWLDEIRKGLKMIKASIYEAGTLKAQDRTRKVFPYSTTVDGNELFLVELYPGKDPDTVSGLNDLCVI